MPGRPRISGGAFVFFSVSALLPLYSISQQGPAPQTTTDQSQREATITGTVVSAATGDPLKKARVVLRKTNDYDEVHAQADVSDATGHFSIEHIAPGQYDLTVERTGYVDQQYGQHHADGPGAPLTLAAGQKITDLIFRLQRTAVIAGHVRDEDGEPMPNVTVEVMRFFRSRSGLGMSQVGEGMSNDLGEYRVFDLPPGHYFVRARPRQHVFNSAAGSAHAGYIQMYYPGATDLAGATKIDVKAADEIPGVDFLLTPQRTFKIAGHVFDAIAGRPASLAMVTVRQVDSGMDMESFFGRTDSKTGEFEIPGLLPGSYVVRALWMESEGARPHQVEVNQRVDMGNADVTGISLVLGRGVDIAGRLSREGASASSARQMTVWLFSQSDDWGHYSAPVQTDGSFTLTGVADGSYSIEVRSDCDLCYVKSATGSGIDLIEKSLQVASGTAPSQLDVVYSSETGTVDGSVTTADNFPATAATVTLIPESVKSGYDHRSRSAITDQYGKFEIRGVPPGHYKAIAWEREDAEDDSLLDLDSLRTRGDNSESVDVSAGGNVALELKLTALSADSSQN